MGLFKIPYFGLIYKILNFIKNHTYTISLWAIIVFSIFCFITIAITYISYFGTDISGIHGIWAEFGSFFGGVTSPLLYFLSILILALTLKAQIDLKKEETYSNNKNFLLTYIYENAKFRNNIIHKTDVNGKAVTHDLNEIIKRIEFLKDEEKKLDKRLAVFVTQPKVRIKFTKYVQAITSIISVIKQVVNSQLSYKDKKNLLDVITSLTSNEERILIVLIFAFEIEDVLSDHKYLKIKELNLFKHFNSYTTDAIDGDGYLIPDFVRSRFRENYFPLIPISKIEA